MSSSSKIVFVAEPRADVVLVSSDDIRFPVRKVSLQANSDVFDDMFTTSSGVDGEKDKNSGLPVIKIDEKGEDIDFLLRLFTVKQVRSDVTQLSLVQALRCVQSVDKSRTEL